MPHYELLYLLPATYAEEELAPIKEKIKALIKHRGGQITAEDSLGKRKLAYPVKKFRQGYYLLNEFDIEPQALNALNNDLRLTNEVLRHTIVIKKPIRFNARKIRRQKLPVSALESQPTKPLAEPPEDKTKLADLDRKLDELLEGDIL